MSGYIEGFDAGAGGFDLRIQIGGLCMLVPDPSRKRLHVLMPAARHGHHRHDPLVRFVDGKILHDFPLGRTLDLTSLGSGNPVLDSIRVPHKKYPPGDPKQGEEEHHFHLYYKLFDRPPRHPPVPRYREPAMPYSNPRCILSRASVVG